MIQLCISFSQIQFGLDSSEKKRKKASKPFSVFIKQGFGHECSVFSQETSMTVKGMIHTCSETGLRKKTVQMRFVLFTVRQLEIFFLLLY